MPNIILKRPFRTPHGRFNSPNAGVPVYIPTHVIKRYGLPKDAVEVGDDYIPPADREPEYESVEETAAKQEQAINEQVNKRLADMAKNKKQSKGAKGAKGAKKQPKDANNISSEQADILEMEVDDIKSFLPDMSREDLIALFDAEKIGKNRKAVISAIEDTGRLHQVINPS